MNKKDLPLSIGDLLAQVGPHCPSKKQNRPPPPPTHPWNVRTKKAVLSSLARKNKTGMYLLILFFRVDRANVRCYK